MGLFDDFLKNAAKSIDNAIGNGSHQFTDLANKAVKAKEEAIGGNEDINTENNNTTENTNVEEKKIENESVAEALPSREVEAEEYGTPKRKISFSLSQDFIYQDADMDFPISFLYKPGGEDWKDYGFNANNINLYLSENIEIGSIVEEYKEKGTISDSWNLTPLNGKYLFKANKKFYNKVIYIYGFDRDFDNGKNNALIVEYPVDKKGTALESKLMKELDEVANTYTETILN